MNKIIVLLSLVFVLVISSVSMAAIPVPVDCLTGSPVARTTETISFVGELCYATVSDAYTAWYSTDLRLRASDAVIPDAGITFDFMADNQVVSLKGGYTATWVAPATAPVYPTDYSIISGPVTITGTAAVSASNIIIK